MDKLNNLCLYELKRIARELKTKGRSKMGRMDLINEFKKYKEEEIIDLIEKVTTTRDYICIHGKIKYFCKECGGSQICEHDRIKYACKECKGSQYMNVCIISKNKSVKNVADHKYAYIINKNNNVKNVEDHKYANT